MPGHQQWQSGAGLDRVCSILAASYVLDSKARLAQQPTPEANEQLSAARLNAWRQIEPLHLQHAERGCGGGARAKKRSA